MEMICTKSLDFYVREFEKETLLKRDRRQIPILKQVFKPSCASGSENMQEDARN